ncbi:nuclear transport factor 2 family protein [Cryobacterium algoricola]|uniref:Nuclear transport factor 2 family protein n=1 Tax=Cryobacterium algoricola TaxID=1259183 RepID=A0ABY2IFI2_9MICO|nr:nuclear transport factor 2 family protein [Cryobacterium algoricola]TFB87402.1 nuclear transport factor 2 family protein [Cryobacterium algoricola]
MWQSDASEFLAVQDAELALLSSTVRSDAEHVSSLLADDFAEIGRSGRRWTYGETVAALQVEGPRATPVTSEWLFYRLSSELILVTYRLHGTDHDSRHSSLWELAGPVLRFHQSTSIPSS